MTAKSTEPRWRLVDPLAGYVLAFVLSGLTLTIALGAGVEEGTIGEFLGGQVGFWAGLVGVVVLASHVSGTGNPRTDLRLRSSRTDALVGIAAGVATQLVVIPLLYAPMGFLVDDLDLSGKAQELFDSPGPTFLLALAVVFVAPIVEELFFRGLLFGALLVRWGERVAIVGSSVFFGVTHFQLLQLPALIAAGLCFAILRARTGALGPSIWAHVAFNTSTVILLLA